MGTPLTIALPTPVPQASLSPSSGGFADLDERLGHVGDGSVLTVHVASEAAAHAIREHVARRLAATFRVLRAEARASAPLFGEVAKKLDVDFGETDPARFAVRLAQAARSARAALVLAADAPSAWDRAVTHELARMGGAPPIVMVGSDAAHDELPGDTFEVAASLDANDRALWLAAIAQDATSHVTTFELAALERWWAAARRSGAHEERASIPEVGRTLFVALAIAERAWPVAELPRLGGDRAMLDALLDVGAVQIDAGWVSLAADRHDDARDAAGTAQTDSLRHVARALASLGEGDPWALSRAATLLLRAGEAEAADELHGRALARTSDVLTRRELVERWARALATSEEGERLPLSMRAAERALLAGEAEEAYRAAQAASVIAPQDASVALLLGRAAVAMGDLVAAKVALDRARSLAAKDDAALAAKVAVELSEVAYVGGDLDLASTEAHLGTAHEETRLHARNTLGKVLLAQSKWEEAERHFTEDAFHASVGKDRAAELRARLNRGIALLSKGLLDEARAIFDEVGSEGERLGEPRACAFALENLAVVAMWRHDYGAALGLLERAFKAHQRLGDRLKIAHNLGNLAQLRYKLGLFDHAEHAILFGRRTLGPGMPPHNAARFSMVAARLALGRGNTALAQREVARAIVDGEHAGHRLRMAGEAYRLAARIALEDGDLGRAEDALAKARTMSSDEEARAEVAYLDAVHGRASGKPVMSSANEALLLARALGEEELLRDAHVLLHEMHRSEGNLALARDHIEQAIALRDQVANVLAGEVRIAFLARPDVAGLARLAAQTAADLSDDALDSLVPSSEPSSDDAPRASVPNSRVTPMSTFPREIVGEDPTVRALRAAIKKVARADSTVLIRGESGTGKELVAEALHRASERANGPLVTVNCAALVETLLLSELFGHEKGAFTGASARRRGRFELAEGGTLFLDEIGDISSRTQVALLRVLQERTFERVGGTTSLRANVRIVCATHRDLKAMVERGEFREDLYYRLRGITLEVPALRQRTGDLPRICENLLARIAHERSEAPKALAPAAVDLLMRHRWPGNIRELENVLRAASLFAEGSVIQVADITENVEDLRALSSAPPSRASLPPAPITAAALSAVEIVEEDASEGDVLIDIEADLPTDEAGASASAYACVRQGAVSLSDLKRQIERDCIARALAETRGNITRAAALLGMKRPRLSQLVKQYGLAAVSEGSS